MTDRKVPNRAFAVHPLKESAAPSAYACGKRWTWRTADGKVGGHTVTELEAKMCSDREWRRDLRENH